MIEINERFYIGATQNQYVLKEKSTIKNKNSKNYGKTVYKDLGFYNELDGLLEGLLKVEIREFISEEGIKSLNDLIKQIKSIKKELKKFNEKEL